MGPTAEHGQDIRTEKKEKKEKKKIKKKTKVKEKNSDLVLSESVLEEGAVITSATGEAAVGSPSHADEIEERTLNRALSSSSFRAGLATERARVGPGSSNSSLGSRRSSRSGSSWETRLVLPYTERSTQMGFPV